MIWIAVDAMGGDFAPRHVVDGALAAARHFDLGVTLVGPTASLEAELARHPMSTAPRARRGRAGGDRDGRFAGGGAAPQTAGVD